MPKKEPSKGRRTDRKIEIGKEIDGEIAKAQRLMFAAKEIEKRLLVISENVEHAAFGIMERMALVLERSSIDRNGKIHFPEKPEIDISKLNGAQKSFLIEGYKELRRIESHERQWLEQNWERLDEEGRRYALEDHILTVLSVRFCNENLGITDETVKQLEVGLSDLMDAIKKIEPDEEL